MRSVDTASSAEGLREEREKSESAEEDDDDMDAARQSPTLLPGFS